MIAIAVCWSGSPMYAGADAALPIPRTSSVTDQNLHDEALYLKEETVSIASRYEQPISRTPSDVYVITDEDIRHSGATDIPTLLRQVPGMEVMQTNAVDFNVSERGYNQLQANKLLVLVDGRSIYIDQSGQVLWKLLPVTLTEIKRIEVLKGPASAVYGFNAFDGVVNIITKSPEEIRGSTLQVAGGELGTILTNGVHAGTVGDWGYGISGGHEQDQRWSDRHAPALNSQRFGGMAEYRLAYDGRIRADIGLSRANPYNGFVTEANSSDNHMSQAHGVLIYEQGAAVRLAVSSDCTIGWLCPTMCSYRPSTSARRSPIWRVKAICAIALSITMDRCSGSNGFVRKSQAPSCIASTTLPIVPNAVKTITPGIACA